MAGVMIAAPGSGSGKTMVTCGLLTLLKRKGYNPAAFKCGPDYIDGLFHRRVLGVENGNLDSFFETGTHMRQKLSRSMERHFVVAEGVMGYFDGLGGVSVQGSSFEIGSILGLPAILVVDGRGASLSLMALIQGFLEYDAMLEGKGEEKTHDKTDCDAECAAGMQYEECRKRRWKENEENYREKRARALYSEDERKVLRKSHENPDLMKLYSEYLGEPNGHLSHHLLHTHYVKRGKYNQLV